MQHITNHQELMAKIENMRVTHADLDFNPVLEEWSSITDDVAKQMVGDALSHVVTDYPDALFSALFDEDYHIRAAAVKFVQEMPLPFVVDALLEALKNRDKDVRAQVAYLLGDIGDARAVPSLVAVLRDRSWDVRWQAASALYKIGDPRGRAFAIDAVRNRNPKIRQAALTTLVSMYDETLPLDPFITALHDPSPEVRAIAADRLAEIGDPIAVPHLLKLLHDPDPYVRECTVGGLSWLGDPRAGEGLMTLLQDSSPEVRASAVSALAEIGYEPAVAPLLQLLNDDSQIIIAVIKALGRMHVHDAVPQLIGLLHHHDATVRVATVASLVQIGDAQAVPALQASLDDPDPEMRGEIALALASLVQTHQFPIDLSATVPILIEQAESRYYQTQLEALTALGMIGGNAAFDALVRHTHDKDTLNRAYAVLALGRLADPRAIPMLQRALDDNEDALIPANAIRGLVRLQALELAPVLAYSEKPHEHRIRRAAVEMLTAFSEPTASERLRHVANDEEEDLLVRMEAAHSLAVKSEPYPIKPFTAALAPAENQYIQLTSVRIVKELRDCRAVDALLGLLNDDEMKVRLAVTEALTTITGKRYRMYQ